MRIRAYGPGDLAAIARLFHQTVHGVGARYYEREQLDAWAPGDLDPAAWEPRLARNFARVAEEDGAVVGFAELSPEGLVDMLYVHKDHQGRGVASALLAELESRARAAGHARLTTNASRVAKPFFQRRGFAVLDDGPGIPDELKDRIFQPFVTSRKGGVGLGLTFVKRVVHDHHGVVSLESQPGRGTLATVRLPLEVPER